MREGWTPFRLGDLIRLEYGKALPAKQRSGSGYPVFGSAGEVGRHSEFLVNGPGIVVGRKGTAGSVTWTDEAFYPIDTTYWVHILSDVLDLRFAFLLLSASRLDEVTTQTGVPGLNRENAYRLEVSIPPIEEQRRIVDLVGHVDSLRTAISEEAARVFAALCAFRDSIWNVPQRVPLSRYCRVDSGLVDPTGGGQRDRPHVGTDRIVSGTGDLIGVQSASEDGVTSGKFEFSERHVVYSKIRPNLMKVAMPTFSGLCSADAYPLLPAPGVPRRWLQQLLLTTEFTTLAVSQSGRTKMPKINQSALMGLMVPDIADEVREEQAVALDALDALRVGLGEELDALDRQRVAMLGSLLTGQHEVPASYDEFISDEGAA